MASGKNDIAVDFVRECLRYDSGKLFWLPRPIEHFSTVRAFDIYHNQCSGNEAGYLKRYKAGDRWVIGINGRHYLRSRIVWAIHNGRWPECIVDHKNRNTIDDRIDNLREATVSQNARNIKTHIDNASGFKGVCWHNDSRKWRATIKVDGKVIDLGRFDAPEDAHAAYRNAAEYHFGEFACAGVP